MTSKTIIIDLIVTYWYVNFNENIPEFGLETYQIIDERDTLNRIMLANKYGEVYNDNVKEGDVIFVIKGVLHCLPKELFERWILGQQEDKYMER